MRKVRCIPATDDPAGLPWQRLRAAAANPYGQVNAVPDRAHPHLYERAFESDSCGFGLLTQIDGRASGWVVDTAFAALAKLPPSRRLQPRRGRGISVPAPAGPAGRRERQHHGRARGGKRMAVPHRRPASARREGSQIVLPVDVASQAFGFRPRRSAWFKRHGVALAESGRIHVGRRAPLRRRPATRAWLPAATTCAAPSCWCARFGRGEAGEAVAQMLRSETLSPVG